MNAFISSLFLRSSLATLVRMQSLPFGLENEILTRIIKTFLIISVSNPIEEYFTKEKSSFRSEKNEIKKKILF